MFFVRYALVFCIVAFLVALCANVLMWLTLFIAAHFSPSGVLFSVPQRHWLVVFAVWWAISFFIAIPFVRRPFRLF